MTLSYFLRLSPDFVTCSPDGMSAGENKRDIQWKKIGSCLYRYVPSGAYYGLIKFRGKQIRRTLETLDLPPRPPEIAGLRRDIELTDPELAHRTLESQAQRFPVHRQGTRRSLPCRKTHWRPLLPPRIPVPQQREHWLSRMLWTLARLCAYFFPVSALLRTR